MLPGAMLVAVVFDACGGWPALVLTSSAAAITPALVLWFTKAGSRSNTAALQASQVCVEGGGGKGGLVQDTRFFPWAVRPACIGCALALFFGMDAPTWCTGSWMSG